MGTDQGKIFDKKQTIIGFTSEIGPFVLYQTIKI